ncbi:MAG: type 2 lantipeptide synthetase LanM family protein [Ktedonobacteraceae bacterium]|nr:type 2 lantipeptide synthetase LanM family protein [Ktedonobacteraceae bacterium]
MKKTLAKAAHTMPQRWQNPTWYHALSLAERIASLRASTHDASFSTPQYTERAARRLQAWKTQKSFDQGRLFANRLAMDGITEDDLYFLLAEPIAALQSRYLHTSSTPDWLATLVEAFEDYSTDDVMFQQMATEQSFAPYLLPILPLIRHGFDRLLAGIQVLYQQYASPPFEPEQIIQAFFPQLSERLLGLVNRTFVLEMHVARIQHRLRGETEQERFTDFVRQLSQEGKILTLLEEYPVLARQLVLTVDHWVNYAHAFLAHLCADWQDIRSTFTPEHDPGLLVEVRGGVGDRHREGRSVLVLKFSSGFQVLYKPKSLAIDVHFQQFLVWLNEQGVQPAFRVVSIIDRGSYGWVEFVHAASCTSPEEIARFYERQGSYLALLYALDATDIHGENLIAAGEHPILIDLEALFHGRVGGDDPTQTSQLIFMSMEQSVFRVGLLPFRMWSTKEAIGLDVSGLGGQEEQLTPIPLPKWEGVGTDQMRLIRERRQVSVNQNRPKLNGQDVDVLNYSKHIVAGFKSMYQLLQERHGELIADILPRFAHDEVRVLLRPTNRYVTLFTESLHPDLLRDGLERERYFDDVWREVESRPYLSRVIAAEQRSLLLGDIPMFLTHPDSRAIFTSDGESLGDFFDEPSLELVKRRLQHLDEQDLARQTWIIQATLATLLLGPEQIMGNAFQLKPAQSPVSRERLIASACAVGERLDKLAVRTDDAASWLGVNLVNQNAWSLLPTDADLYSGTGGIALFLSYLGALTGQAHYSALARLALASVRLEVEQQKKDLQSVPFLGGFTGLGSTIYLLTHLSVLWNEPTLLQEAEALVELLPALIARDEHLDIISGSTGCILNLLSLYAVHPSTRTLDVALQCGDRLLATALSMQEGLAWKTVKHEEKPLGGFSHGTAGVALSLFKLAKVSGQERYHQAALAALAYDRSLLLSERQYWAELDKFSSLRAETTDSDQVASETQEKPLVAWCHGLPGIGMGRLGALKCLDDATIREEIDLAIKATIAGGLNESHSLCHGALGNLDLLLTATQVLNNPRYHEALERVTAMIVDSIDEYGWVTGVPLGVETPGLMTGIAGIGYELLRLAEPERVPSVLLLAPPSQ